MSTYGYTVFNRNNLEQLERKWSSKRMIVDVGSRTTKILCSGNTGRTTITMPTVVHAIGSEYGRVAIGSEYGRVFYIGVGKLWCTSQYWFWVRPFKDLASFREHVDAGVYFLTSLMANCTPTHEGLLCRLKPRREIAVALPTWLMADMELALKFYGEVSKSLKRYSITFVDSRVALAAYMNKRFVKEHDFCKMSTRAASK